MAEPAAAFALWCRVVGGAQAYSKLWDQARDVVYMNWHLGFTAFGGPPVHFQIVCASPSVCLVMMEDMLTHKQFRKKFVNEKRWIDEQIVRRRLVLRLAAKELARLSA